MRREPAMTAKPTLSALMPSRRFACGSNRICRTVLVRLIALASSFSSWCVGWIASGGPRRRSGGGWVDTAIFGSPAFSSRQDENSRSWQSTRSERR